MEKYGKTAFYRVTTTGLGKYRQAPMAGLGSKGDISKPFFCKM